MSLRFAIGMAAGYVLGARAGRQRYDEISREVREFVDSDLVRQLRAELPGWAAGASRDPSGVVAPPVIVGPGPRGRSDSRAGTVELPDVEPSSASSAPSAAAAPTQPAKRLDPPQA